MKNSERWGWSDSSFPRRDFLRVGALTSLLGVSLPEFLRLKSLRAETERPDRAQGHCSSLYPALVGRGTQSHRHLGSQAQQFFQGNPHQRARHSDLGAAAASLEPDGQACDHSLHV